MDARLVEALGVGLEPNRVTSALDAFSSYAESTPTTCFVTPTAAPQPPPSALRDDTV